MVRSWVVRLLSEDGTSVEGRLDVDDDRVSFRPGISGATVPPLVIDRAQIAGVEPLEHDVVHRLELILFNGRHLVIDNGLRPTDELAELLTS